MDEIWDSKDQNFILQIFFNEFSRRFKKDPKVNLTSSETDKSFEASQLDSMHAIFNKKNVDTYLVRISIAR